jgi:peptidoglycan/LPS O-acetylase OafA/YrhL
MPKIAESSRIESIDALRAIAALTVLLFHFESFALTPVGQFGAFIPAESQNFHLALMGVELFFVISGFVISWTIERTGSAKKFFYEPSRETIPRVLGIIGLFGSCRRSTRRL